MATAKKLPSGQWRALVYDYTDANGKRHYESFTADTKKEAEFLAAEFALTKKERIKNNQTVAEAIDMYIERRTNILSPASIRGYKQMYKYYGELSALRLKNLKQRDVELWVNGFSKTHSPKTVRNAYGLLKSVLAEYAPSLSINVKMPQKVKPTYHVPNDSEIKQIISYYKEHDTDMLLAVYLAAFGTMRRSEICGLTADDVSGDTVHVRSAMVKDENREWKIKTTKTVSSDRYVQLPSFVIESLPKSGRIVKVNPDYITHTFGRTLKRLGIPSFRFHDLRHYSASILHAIGIPDQYIMARGGWSSDAVLKQVYRGIIDDYNQRYNNVANDYFEKMQHEMQHENEKPR